MRDAARRVLAARGGADLWITVEREAPAASRARN